MRCIVAKKTREAKPGELRGIHIIETMERMSKRPETRIDLQKALDGLSADSKAYAKHLVTSGPSANSAAMKILNFAADRFEGAVAELESALNIKPR